MHRRLLLVPLIVLLAARAGTSAGAAVLDVGVGQTFASLAAAVAAASAGDTIDVHAGTYTDQVALIGKPLTIRGVGGTPVFIATTDLSNGKGFLVVNASTTIDNIEFDSARVPDGNGAGIRQQAGDLVVSNSRFVGNQDGILATPFTGGTGSLLVANSTFVDNGVASGPFAGFAHAIYATDLASLTVRNSRFAGTQVGHDIKSRAATTQVSGTELDDGVTGTTSYAIDISNGGVATITGNIITQGSDTQNESMIAYAAEGLRYADNVLLVQGNVFDNSLPGNSIGVFNHAAGVNAGIVCNAFNGVANPVVGKATLRDNAFNAPLPACAAIPEPGMLPVLLTGGVVLLGAARRQRGISPPLVNHFQMPVAKRRRGGFEASGRCGERPDHQ